MFDIVNSKFKPEESGNIDYVDVEVLDGGLGCEGIVILKWGTMYVCVSLRQVEKPALATNISPNLYWEPKEFFSDDFKTYMGRQIEMLIKDIVTEDIPITLGYEMVIYTQGQLVDKGVFLYLILSGVLKIFRRCGFYMIDAPMVILFGKSSNSADSETEEPIPIQRWSQLELACASRLFLVVASTSHIYRLIPLRRCPGVSIPDISKLRIYFTSGKYGKDNQPRVSISHM